MILIEHKYECMNCSNTFKAFILPITLKIKEKLYGYPLCKFCLKFNLLINTDKLLDEFKR